MKKKFDVVVIGNIGIDTNIYLKGDGINWQVEANFTDNIDYIGQAGGYASRLWASFKKNCAFIGYVGNDYMGKFIKESLQKSGIDTSGVFIDPAGTSRSVNLVFLDGKRKNFYDGKSHMTLSPNKEICSRILEGAQLVHFNIPNWARELLPMAKQKKAIISCDLQDVIDLNDPYRQDFVNYSDFIFFSTVNIKDPYAAISHYLSFDKNKIIVAAMGEHGVMVGHLDEIKHYNIPVSNLPVVDTNGAGDSLAAGFLLAYIFEKKKMEDAVLSGQLCARHTCSLKATSENLYSQPPTIVGKKNKF